jgi:hypothetical protein
MYSFIELISIRSVVASESLRTRREGSTQDAASCGEHEREFEL